MPADPAKWLESSATIAVRPTSESPTKKSKLFGDLFIQCGTGHVSPAPSLPGRSQQPAGYERSQVMRRGCWAHVGDGPVVPGGDLSKNASHTALTRRSSRPRSVTAFVIACQMRLSIFSRRSSERTCASCAATCAAIKGVTSAPRSKLGPRQERHRNSRPGVVPTSFPEL